RRLSLRGAVGRGESRLGCGGPGLPAGGLRLHPAGGPGGAAVLRRVPPHPSGRLRRRLSMDHKEAHHLRLYVLAALIFIVAAVYVGVLYDTQVNKYDYYYASSVRSIARSETVEAARGNITDRNGKVLVSSRSSYNLTFDASLLEEDED